jgi:hypothetical protein
MLRRWEEGKKRLKKGRGKEHTVSSKIQKT